MPCATKLVISKVAIPKVELFQVPASTQDKEADPTSPAGAPGSSLPGAALKKMDRTIEGETSGLGSDEYKEEEDQLTAQLQAYFLESIRWSLLFFSFFTFFFVQCALL